MPKWMDAVEDFTPAKSAGLGVVVNVVNPKNLILIIGVKLIGDATSGSSVLTQRATRSPSCRSRPRAAG